MSFDLSFVRRSLPVFFEGMVVTVELAVLAIAISLVWGLLIAVLRQWAPAPLRWLAAAYVEIVRNTPILVQIYFIYFGLAVAGVRVTGFGSALIALAAQNGGYMSEIYRAGIQSISIKQIESAKALGMRLPTILSMIVLPQAFRHVIPPVGNQSILILEGHVDRGHGGSRGNDAGRQDADRAHGGGLRGLFTLALLYLALCTIVAGLFRLLERRLAFPA